MQRNTGYFPTESLEPSGNRLFSRSALNEGDLFRGSLVSETSVRRAAVYTDFIGRFSSAMDFLGVASNSRSYQSDLSYSFDELIINYAI